MSAAAGDSSAGRASRHAYVPGPVTPLTGPG